MLAELDHPIAREAGVDAELALLEEVSRGAYRLAPFGPDDVGDASEVVRRYRELDIGLADASIAVLSRRHACLDVLTLDERHFRALRGHRGRRLAPAARRRSRTSSDHQRRGSWWSARR